MTFTILLWIKSIFEYSTFALMAYGGLAAAVSVYFALIKVPMLKTPAALICVGISLWGFGALHGSDPLERKLRQAQIDLDALKAKNLADQLIISGATKLANKRADTINELESTIDEYNNELELGQALKCDADGAYSKRLSDILNRL